MIALTGIAFLKRDNSVCIAYKKLAGKKPTIVFLPGFRSDMEGTKATMLWTLAKELGHACLLFDYRGHGHSNGRFEDGCVGEWADDAIHAIDTLTEGPLVLIGSSMGGWIMLLMALARTSRIAGLIGIAPAPDFTERLMKPSFTKAQWQEMEEDGEILLPSQYGDPTPVTRKLLEDGPAQLVMDKPIKVDCPVYLLHGQDDPDVPWQTSIDLAAKLTSKGVTIELIKDGDHRLSRDSDLARLKQLAKRMLASI